MANHLEHCEIILSSKMLTTISRVIFDLIFCLLHFLIITHILIILRRMITCWPRCLGWSSTWSAARRVDWLSVGHLSGLELQTMQIWGMRDMRGNVDHDNDPNKTVTSTKTSPDCLEAPLRKFPPRDSDRWVRWAIEHNVIDVDSWA